MGVGCGGVGVCWGAVSGGAVWWNAVSGGVVWWGAVSGGGEVPYFQSQTRNQQPVRPAMIS